MDLRNIVNNDDNSGSIFSLQSSPSRSKQGSLASLLNTESTAAGTAGAKKPKRYDTIPIWAQTWSASQTMPNSVSNHNEHSSRISEFKLMSKEDIQPSSLGHIGPGGYPSLLGLPSSLTGVIPADDVTTKVCSWLYSHLFQLEDQRKFIELEFKMGQIIDRNSNQRASLPCITETVVSPEYARERLTFEASIESSQFSRVEYLISGLSKRQGAAPLTKLPDIRQKDVIYAQQGSGANIRLSYDENNNLVDRLIKKRIANLLIFCPGDLTDWRVSLSTEVQFSGSTEELTRPNKIRNKNRQSWQTNGLQVDLTGVISEGGDQSKSKEVELEMDKDLIIQCFDNFQSKKDGEAMDKFQELIRFGVDSCRTISRFISR